MAELTRDGVRIHWERHGPGTGLPVLLSHGFGETSAMWQPNLPALAAGRPVLSWDMRGHGQSDSPADPAAYTQAACLQDMAAILDAAGAARAVLGGLSLGGYLSLAFWREFPDRVAALMLFDTGPGFRKDEAREQWNERALATAARYDRDGLSGDLAARHASASGLALAARGMLTQHDASVMDTLPAVDVPVLVLVGSRDRAFLGAADYMAAKIADATHVVIPDAGHLSNVHQPGLFDQAVLAFLESLPAAS